MKIRIHRVPSGGLGRIRPKKNKYLLIINRKGEKYLLKGNVILCQFSNKVVLWQNSEYKMHAEHCPSNRMGVFMEWCLNGKCFAYHC